MKGKAITRRRLLQNSALVGAAALTGRSMKMASADTSQGTQNQGKISLRPLGKTGLQVSALGVGGYHIGSARSLEDASNIISQAIDAGINFFDNCWEYHDGKSEEWMGHALQGKRDKVV